MASRSLRTITIIIMLVFVFTSIDQVECSFAAGNNRIKLTNINNSFVIQKGQRYKITYEKYGKAAKYKVRFKSSNKKIATVSRKGVIRGKKKGTVKITAYVKIKGKKKYKKTIKIKVGARVKKITIKGDKCVRQGDTITLSKSISPSSARNKNVTWSSADTSIAKVSSSGKVKGVKEGTTVIKAKAKDGSKVVAEYAMHVYKFQKSDANWVAHRGLHTSALENTATAFEAAGKTGGFWGCECDIRETKHVNLDPEDPQEESFDIVINHDNTYKRTLGVNKKVADMTKEEVMNDPKLAGKVCFLDEYLEICQYYGMVPVIELKLRDNDTETRLSPEAIRKAVDIVYEAGGTELLQRADWISFYSGSLDVLQNYLRYIYGVDTPNITYLISGSCTKSEAMAKIDLAKNHGYSNVSINKDLLSTDISDRCASEVKLDAWTFANSLKDKYKLHRILEHSSYDLEHITVDYKPW